MKAMMQTRSTQACRSASAARPTPAMLQGFKPSLSQWGPQAQQVSCKALPWESEGGVSKLLQRVGTGLVSSVLAASLMLTSTPSASAETMVVRIPASSNPEVFAAQRTLIETWAIVGESFVDPTFNSHDWLEELKQHMLAAYQTEDPSKAWSEINSMLSDLGDPYTRRIDPEDYQMFRVSADGELQGIGLLIANDLSNSGHLRVLAPIKGGPADRAGILPGDEVLSINGEDTKGWTGEQAARVLRGQGGTEVHVKLARRTEGIPGVASRPEPQPRMQFKEVALRREAVAISPVFATMLSSPSSGAPVGYVRLSQFSDNAGVDMRKAVASLKAQGAERYILDLRSNPGGLVSAGVDVASLWLEGEQPVFAISARDEAPQVQTTLDTKQALTKAPLVVLVNNMSASASEIVSGALHDNHRAVIMGDTATYGKGRIQSVYELQDGSALFVTVAKYVTPSGSDIDKRGIEPDRACRVPVVASAPDPQAKTPALVSREVLGSPVLQQIKSSAIKKASPELLPAAGSKSSSGATASADKVEDTGFVPGIPLDNSTEQLLLDALTRDRCVLAAEHFLDGLDKEDINNTKPDLTPAQHLYLALTHLDRATV